MKVLEQFLYQLLIGQFTDNSKIYGSSFVFDNIELKNDFSSISLKVSRQDRAYSFSVALTLIDAENVDAGVLVNIVPCCNNKAVDRFQTYAGEIPTEEMSFIARPSILNHGILIDAIDKDFESYGSLVDYWRSSFNDADSQAQEDFFKAFSVSQADVEQASTTAVIDLLPNYVLETV